MNASFFENNRRRLREVVESPIIIVSGNKEMQRRADAAFMFVQEANFYYLTGIREPGWLLLIENEIMQLVAPERSETQTIFDGSLSHDDASHMSGINNIITYQEYSEKIAILSKQYEKVGVVGPDPHDKYYEFTKNPGPNDIYEQCKKQFVALEDIRPPLAKLRSIKQPEEIERIKTAISISIEAFENVKNTIKTLQTESEINAQLYYDFYRKTSGGHAYDPIVAAGKNACTLHYASNNQPLVKDGLVLIDAGAQYDEYAADITRTYAVGRPSERHQAIHKAVQQAHYEIINLIKPGVSLREYSERADDIMKETIRSVGLLKTDEDMRKYFPHAISHGLGIDVHESLGGHDVFEPGMVLTVEPGIYIPEEGIGVRIEDDILVTSDRNENLTASLSTEL